MSQRVTRLSSAPVKTYLPLGSKRHAVSGRACFHWLPAWVCSGSALGGSWLMSRDQLRNRVLGRIGDGKLASANVELGFRVNPHAAEHGMEDVSVIDYAVGHLRTVVVGFADDRAGFDPRAAEQHAPRGPPVIAAVVLVDLGRAAKFRHHAN